jgi:hypothetical protein
MNSAKCNDAIDDAHVCSMTRLFVFRCYKTFPKEGPTTMKTRMQESKEHRRQFEKHNFS